MSETRWRDRNIIGSPPGTAPDKETDRDTSESGDQGLRRRRTPAPGIRGGTADLLRASSGMSEPLARRRVAKILCFAGRAEPQR
jgi:hypothetical protein